MSRVPVMPLYVDDFKGATAILTLEEIGAYISILMFIWTNNGVPVVDDPLRLSRICGCTCAHFAEALRPALLPYFDLSGGTWRNPRLEAEWARVQDLRRKRTEAGAKGNASQRALASANACAIAVADGPRNADAIPTPDPTPSHDPDPAAENPPPPQGGIVFSPPLLLTNPETPAARLRDRAERKSKRGQVAPEVQQQALRVLEALNVARQRVGFKGRGLGPIPANLGEITARLAEGTAVEDCLHVVSVCEFECQRPGEDGATARQYFDAVTPFRPQNFARKLGRQVDQGQQAQWQQDQELRQLWDGET